MYLLTLAAADLTGDQILQWLNMSALVVIVALFIWGRIMPTSLVQSEMAGPLRDENRELREMVKQAVATCERQAGIIEDLSKQLTATSAQLGDVVSRILDENKNSRGGARVDRQ